MKIGISKWAVVLFFISSVGILAQDNKQNPQPQDNKQNPQSQQNVASVKPGDEAKEKLKEFKAAFSKSKSEAEKAMLLQGIRDLDSKETLAEISKIAKSDKYEGIRKAAIVQIGDRFRGKEAAVALKDAWVSAAQKQIKEIQILAVEQMGRMASIPVATTKDKNTRQTIVFKPDPKTTEYASIFLIWLITTRYKEEDEDILVVSLNSIGKLRSRASVDPLLAFLKYYENLRSQLSQQVKEVDTSKLSQMRDQAKQQAQQAQQQAAQAPQTTTTTTTTPGSGGYDVNAEKAAMAQKYGIGNTADDYNKFVGGAAGQMRQNAAGAQDALAGTGMEDLGAAIGGMNSGIADLMDSVVNMNGTIGGTPPSTTTTTTTTGGAPATSTPGTSTAPSSMNASDALVTTGQTYAQRFPQLDARCKKLIPATVNSLKGVTKQGYYGWADWTKWWDRNKGIWKPE